MKTPLLLAVSLALNLALAAGLLLTRSSSRESLTPAPQNSPASSTAARPHSLPSSIAASSTDSSFSDRVSADTLWPRLHATDDLDQLAARLAQAGFTRREIVTVIDTLGRQKFDAERAALRAGEPERPYWKPQPFRFNSSASSPENRAKEADISLRQSAFHEKHNRMSELIAEDEAVADDFRNRYGPLPLEKLTRLADIESDYQQLQLKLHIEQSARTNQQSTAADREKYRLLAAEQEADIRQLLSPEEYSAYILRESRTAQELRSRLNLLRLTETEYKALFALQRPIDEQFIAAADAGDEAQGKARRDALKNLAPQIEAALGPDRYADYEQLMKGGDDQITRLMSRLELPLATAGKITSLRDTATEQAAALRNDSTLTPAERDARLRTLARETEKNLGTLLRTPRGLEAYSELKGDWLRALHLKPAAP